MKEKKIYNFLILQKHVLIECTQHAISFDTSLLTDKFIVKKEEEKI